MQQIARPMPVPDDLTRPFWDAAERGELHIQRCQRCQRYHHPPVATCRFCLASEGELSPAPLAFEQVSGRGRVHSYTIVHDSRLEGFSNITPYRLVEVELQEQAGLILYGNLPDSPPGPVPVDARVELMFISIGEGMKLPDFRLVNGGSGGGD